MPQEEVSTSEKNLLKKLLYKEEGNILTNILIEEILTNVKNNTL